MKKSESKHREIFDILRHEILTGKYDERGQFPSELSLARRFGVSRPTVTRALIGLKTSGLLVGRSGSGTFLGANAGFIPPGYLLGAGIAGSASPWLLVPVGLLMGYFVVTAEPAVQVLKKQVETVTSGAVSQKGLSIGLSIGVGVSVAIGMLRILTGLPLFPFVAAGYIISLAISFFVPPVYTGIAFDSGGVASGPMTSTFMLPFAVGACEALQGNVLTQAFGLVAMVAMAPLITIQSLGLYGNLRRRAVMRRAADEMRGLSDVILYYDREEKPQQEVSEA